MMIYPPVDKLTEKVGNRYELSVLVAKRAKQLNQGAAPQVDEDKIKGEKNIGVAAIEIYEDKIKASKED